MIRPQGDPPSSGRGPLDFQGFGFDLPDERWLDRLREAEAPIPMGSIGPYQLLKEVVQAFLDDAPRLMAEIHRAVETDDAAVLCSAAHSLKGSMLFLGSTPTFELAQQLETCGAEGTLSGARKSLVTFEQEMDSLISELRGYVHPDQSHG